MLTSVYKDESLIRDTIYEIVSSITPFDHIEEEHLDFVKRWIESGAGLFRLNESNDPSIHLVCYCVVIDQFTNKILLADHKKAELWLPTGGHVDVDEHPKETVKREAKEELGIEAEFLFEEPIFLSVTKTTSPIDRHTDISLWYVLQKDSSTVFNYDEGEFHRVCWFKLRGDEIPFDCADPHLRRFIDKLISRRLPCL